MTQPSEAGSRQAELDKLLKSTYERGYADGMQAAKSLPAPETWDERWHVFLAQARAWGTGIAAAGVFFFLGFFVGRPDKAEIAQEISNTAGIAALVILGLLALGFLRGKK